MIFSIILGLVFLLILIDSIGSKQVRSKVIQAAKSAFEEAMSSEDSSSSLKMNKDLPEPILKYLKASMLKEKAPPTTLRMKLKGARKLATKTKWYPIEQKLFLTYRPIGFISYQDTTLSLFVSLKNFQIIKLGDLRTGKRIFSTFNQAVASEKQAYLEGWTNFCTMLPWQPGFFHSSLFNWEKFDHRQVCMQLDAGSNRVEGVLSFNKSGLVDQFISTLSLDGTHSTHFTRIEINYRDYREYNDLLVPFHFTVNLWTKDQAIQKLVFDVTDLVYDEKFSWW